MILRANRRLSPWARVRHRMGTGVRKEPCNGAKWTVDLLRGLGMKDWEARGKGGTCLRLVMDLHLQRRHWRTLRRRDGSRDTRLQYTCGWQPLQPQGWLTGTDPWHHWSAGSGGTVGRVTMEAAKGKESEYRIVTTRNSFPGESEHQTHF